MDKKLDVTSVTARRRLRAELGRAVDRILEKSPKALHDDGLALINEEDFGGELRGRARVNKQLTNALVEVGISAFYYSLDDPRFSKFEDVVATLGATGRDEDE